MKNCTIEEFSHLANQMYSFIIHCMASSSVLTLRVDSKLKKKLDKLAKTTQRSRSFLAAEAIREYVALNEWQIEEIKKAIQQADAGDFATDVRRADDLRARFPRIPRDRDGSRERGDAVHLRRERSHANEDQSAGWSVAIQLRRAGQVERRSGCGGWFEDPVAFRFADRLYRDFHDRTWTGVDLRDIDVVNRNVRTAEHFAERTSELSAVLLRGRHDDDRARRDHDNRRGAARPATRIRNVLAGSIGGRQDALGAHLDVDHDARRHALGSQSRDLHRADAPQRQHLDETLQRRRADLDDHQPRGTNDDDDRRHGRAPDADRDPECRAVHVRLRRARAPGDDHARVARLDAGLRYARLSRVGHRSADPRDLVRERPARPTHADGAPG